MTFGELNNDILPIGTTYCYAYPPSESSTDWRARIIRYRVVAHRLGLRFLGDEVGEPLSELQPEKIWHAPPETVETGKRYNIRYPKR